MQTLGIRKSSFNHASRFWEHLLWPTNNAHRTNKKDFSRNFWSPTISNTSLQPDLWFEFDGQLEILCRDKFKRFGRQLRVSPPCASTAIPDLIYVQIRVSWHQNEYEGMLFSFVWPTCVSVQPGHRCEPKSLGQNKITPISIYPCRQGLSNDFSEN